MYLSLLSIKNFRCFDEKEHIITLKKGLTVLVGENDSGKSAIMDAIKMVLGTTDMNWYRIDADDFYGEDTTLEIEIICKFEELTEDERAAFLECLTYEDTTKKQPCLYLHWKCKYLSSFKPPRPVTSISTGKDGLGPNLSGEAKELLRVTYLRALRDAYSELKSGKRSRLSQIMQHVSVVDQGEDEYKDGEDINKLSITGIANLSNELLANHPALKSVNTDMTTILSDQMLLKRDSIKVKLEVAGANSNKRHKEMSLLEKLDLTVDKDASAMQGRVGFGTSNIMSMACELLLHKEAEEDGKSCFLLIEEPEAHIHAQRQLKLIQSLENEAEKDNRQIILTTHSPLLASVVKLPNIVIVKSGNVYPLSAEYTMLDADDYIFLEKYLDATKANLFFARSVIIVEGPGEALLLPTLAKLLGCSFTDYGTSLVDVRSTGLRRYAKIFQRKRSGDELDIKVACVTDRDIMPNCAPAICIDDIYTEDKTTWPDKDKRAWRAEADFDEGMAKKHLVEIRKRADGQNVKTYVAGHWTLEYDLAYAGLLDDDMKNILINALMKVSYVAKNITTKTKEFVESMDELSNIEEMASLFYSFFTSKKASKADFAQQLAYDLEQNFKNRPDELKSKLPEYLVQAIEYVAKG
ncbi:AAA family ATPase [[Clostridium] hylemonae]|uniref:ATP-dependent nuclease n=1 Tax=[Clostridium] hylemonae TaxID=89153 RepID=UPI001D08E9B4|nr:AAA family ATPase [[Clostridium] hylemonae]MCB7523285.1 AAA family ATPase [[Clostridium] hylemonae]